MSYQPNKHFIPGAEKFAIIYSEANQNDSRNEGCHLGPHRPEPHRMSNEELMPLILPPTHGERGTFQVIGGEGTSPMRDNFTGSSTSPHNEETSNSRPSSTNNQREENQPSSVYQMLQKQLATVFMKLDEIKEEQQVQRRILSTIQKKIGDIAQVEEVELPHGCRFPLENMDQLDRLEAMLHENNSLQKDLIRQLSIIGGATVKECTRRVMTHVMKNQLAKQLNWLGKAWGDKQRKRAFAHLQLNHLVTKAVLKNTAFQATESDVNNVVKIWLRSSPDRDGGSLRRAMRAVKRHMGMSDNMFKPGPLNP